MSVRLLVGSSVISSLKGGQVHLDAPIEALLAIPPLGLVGLGAIL